MSYVKESDKILFRPFLSSPMILEERDCLLSTQCLTFMMWQEIQRLIEPVIYARSASERLSFKLKRPMDLGTPLGFREVCENLEDLVMEIDREVSDSKDWFFFDALEAHEDNLCSNCKESLRVAFYVTEDRSQALKWKPHGEGHCCQKECKFYKKNIFDNAYVYSDVREVTIEYEGYSN